MVRRLKDFSSEYRLRELDLFSPEERKFQGELISAFQYKKGILKKDGRNLNPTQPKAFYDSMKKGWLQQDLSV